jgi:hypothetical protein
MADPLEALAARAAAEPFFLASVLAAYAQSEGLDDAGLAAALGCPPGELAMLRLCRAPSAAAEDFWEDVRRIAERFGLDAHRLAEVVKRGRVVSRLQGTQPAAGGFLLAARDGEAEPPEKPPEGP